ncbi:hypothetical protein CEE34_02470 [Candidatus Aerophobetes bacterium Ae_b3a]|nr:MAG: hypothetical protein CEE34_02470 [Candidatus Aerophobetes bacterium Ae_b3a]
MTKKSKVKIVLGENDVSKEGPMNPKWAARMLEMGIEGQIRRFKKCPNVLAEMGYKASVKKGERRRRGREESRRENDEW